MLAPLVYWGRPLQSPVAKACVIVNPAAGPTGVKPNWNAITDRLREVGWWVAQRNTTGPGSAGAIAKLAVADGCTILVVAGGDGTINEAIQPLVGSNCVLGLIPVGTANILARELHLPLAPAQATEVLISGHSRPIDLGLVIAPGSPPRFFCEMVGIGFDAAIVGATLPEMKTAMGKGAYVVAAVSTSFTHRPSRMRIVADGRRMRRLCYMLSISNTGLYAADFLKITPEATVDDGLFNAALFRGQSFLLAWRDFFAVAARRLREWTDVEFMTFRRVSVHTGRPVPVQIDGDSAGTTPVTIEIVPRALKVLVP